jgi:hypothetical protein
LYDHLTPRIKLKLEGDEDVSKVLICYAL